MRIASCGLHLLETPFQEENFEDPFRPYLVDILEHSLLEYAFAVVNFLKLLHSIAKFEI
jgi:hypothetical protein